MATLDLNKYKLENNLDKYKVAQPTKIGSQQPKSKFQNIFGQGGKAEQFGSQAGRSLWRTAETIANIPRKVVGAEPLKLPEGLTRKGITPTEKAGGVFGEAIQYLTPVGAETATTKGLTILGKVLKNAPKIVKGASKLGVKSLIGGTEFAGKTALMGGDREDVKSAGVIGLATPPAVKVLGKGLKVAFKDIFPIIAGSMSGIDPKTIKAIFNNPEAIIKNMANKPVPLDVRTKAIEALNKYRTRVGSTFEKGIDSMAKLSPRIKQARTAVGEKYPGVFSGVKGEFKKVMETGKNTLKGTLNKFRVSVKDNMLDFDKLNSSIVSPTERKQIQAVWDTINNQKDFSVKGVQDVASRINVLAKFTDGVKTQSSAIIGNMLNVYKKGIKKVYPELRKLRNQYEVDKKIIKGLEDILKSSKGEVTNPTTATSVAKRLTKLFNEDNEAYVRALKILEEESGEDFISQFIATNFDTWLPGATGSLGSKFAQAGIIGGAIAGGGFINPLIFAVLPLVSPKVVGKIATTIGKSAKVAQKIEPLLPNILK
jgi:hypothetical protein